MLGCWIYFKTFFAAAEEGGGGSSHPFSWHPSTAPPPPPKMLKPSATLVFPHKKTWLFSKEHTSSNNNSPPLSLFCSSSLHRSLANWGSTINQPNPFLLFMCRTHGKKVGNESTFYKNRLLRNDGSENQPWWDKWNVFQRKGLFLKRTMNCRMRNLLK